MFMGSKIQFVAAAALFAAACSGAGQNASAQYAGGPGVETRPPNAEGQTPAFPQQTRAPAVKTKTAYDVVTVVEGLNSPWAMEFLPDGAMLVTEKPGTMQIIGKDGSKRAVVGVPPVDARQQGGLLDVVLDPAFAANQLIYWSFAEGHPDGTTNTAVARGRLLTDGSPRLENVQVIYHQSPAMPSTLHYGSRLVFARDGTLFVTQGERSIIAGRMQAQKLDSLLGKIARINTDGSVPKDNPFVGQEGKRPEIWNYGNRNVQGAALNPKTGELWTVAHGAQGGDELNISRKGLDYGWPTITYGEDYGGGLIGDGITAKEGMEQPIYYWDPVIAPSGMMFYDGPVAEWKGNLFIAGMIAQGVVRLVLDGDKVVGEERLLTDLKKRVRDVRQGPDGLIYVVTERANGTIYKLVPKE
jgi:glucose/arabinose dehydrogenase